jgi:hypothetical protein
MEYRRSAGPIVLDVLFPRGKSGGIEPLLVTGRPSAGSFVYVRYEDERHVRLGVDVWGLGSAISDPVEVDYLATHMIEVSEAPLYPEGHPALQNLPDYERQRLQREFQVRIDGATVLDLDLEQWPSRLRDIVVGRNPIGGSTAGVAFTGRIIDVRRGALAESVSP